MSNTTSTRAFAALMRAQDLSHVFYVPAILREGFVEMSRLGVRPISVHGEKAAAYMADGYARVSGRVGVCMSQAVGATNLAAGLKDAYMSCSPVVAITGGTNIQTKYRQVYQEIRDLQMFDAVTKWNAEVELPARLPDILLQAFRVATSGAPGPVHVEVRGHQGQLALGDTRTEAEFDLAVDKRFAMVPPFRPEADSASIAEAALALTEAERPIIVAGGGVIWSRAEAELVELAEKLSIPVAVSLHAKAAIPEMHGLSVGVCGAYSRECANRAVAEADLVFFVGSRTGAMVTNNWTVPAPGTRILHLDIDPEQLGRHYATAVPLNGDARATLRRIIDATTRRTNPGWTSRVQDLVRRWRAEVAAMVTSDASPIRPERIVTEIAAQLPKNGALVSDTLQAAIWSGSHFAVKASTQRFIRCAGSLGWAIPAAIGAQCALGSRPVICFTGDGGLYYHISELETAARYRVPLVVVVNNNSTYGADNPLEPSPYRNEAEEVDLGWKFGERDFAQLARDFGCNGIRVETANDIAPALRRALASERPTVIDIVSDPTALHPRGWSPKALRS